MKFKIFRFNKIISTNDSAIRIIKNSDYKHGMVVAETQTRGKGQYGKKWISFKGNLFVSFFYTINNIDLTFSKLTKINCLLVKKLLKNYYKKKILFKKPNDLLIQKKKISGILQEVVLVKNNKFLIVGIGINLIKSPSIKNYLTTNLYELCNKPINKGKVEKKLKLIFEKNLSKMYKVKSKLNR